MLAFLAGIFAPWAAWPLRILGAGKAALGWLTASAAHMLLALCAALAVWALLERHDAAKWQRVAGQRQTALNAFENASKAAIAQATAAKEQTDANNLKLAAQADHDYGALRARYDAAVLRLAAAQRRPGSADLPGTAQAPSGGNGPGAGAIVPFDPIPVTEADAMICADNTARLEAVRQWVTGLAFAKGADK